MSVPDVSAARQWPRFAAAATMTGFASVHLLPLRLRGRVIGTLSLFGDDPGTLDEDTRRIGQALADVATIGLPQHRAIHDRDVLTGQLQTALGSRVAIEQAKGILAERLQVSVADAFTLLRNGARSYHRRLSDLAEPSSTEPSGSSGTRHASTGYPALGADGALMRSSAPWHTISTRNESPKVASDIPCRRRVSQTTLPGPNRRYGCAERPADRAATARSDHHTGRLPRPAAADPQGGARRTTRCGERAADGRPATTHTAA